MDFKCYKICYVIIAFILVARNNADKDLRNNMQILDPLMEEQSVKLWNITSVEFDKFLEIYKNNCKPMVYYMPDFRAKGRRISEIKCLEYIWWLRYDIEKRERDFSSCADQITDIPIILGGVDAEIGEIPHVGAIGWSGVNPKTWIFKCGGVLISDKYVLTAAHCSRVSRRDTTVSDVSPKIVRFGVIRILDVDPFGPPKDFRISRFIVHDKYHAPKTYFDIALIELERGVIFTLSVHPACLWTHTSEISGKAKVAGWGVVDTSSRRTSSILQVATIDMVSSEFCNNTLKSRRNRNWSKGLAPHQICAGHMAGGIDACQGDSGGPLHIKLNMPINIRFLWRMHYVVGVTSFGYGCALANTPSVFSKVAHFVDWIENIVWEKDVNATGTAVNGDVKVNKRNIP